MSYCTYDNVLIYIILDLSHDSIHEPGHMLKEVNAGALAVCQEPEQIVDILDYTISGLSFFGGGGFPQTSQGALEVCEDPEKIVHILEYTINRTFFSWNTKKGK